jgi:hypothetical protein
MFDDRQPAFLQLAGVHAICGGFGRGRVDWNHGRVKPYTSLEFLSFSDLLVDGDNI